MPRWKCLSELTHKNAACNLFIYLCLGALDASPGRLVFVVCGFKATEASETAPATRLILA